MKNDLHDYPFAELLEAVRTYPSSATNISRDKFQLVLSHTADIFGVSPADLLGRSRQSHITHPRFAGMVALNSLGLTDAKTAYFFGNRHCSILRAARKKVADLCETDPDFAVRMQRLREAVENYLRTL